MTLNNNWNKSNQWTKVKNNENTKIIKKNNST